MNQNVASRTQSATRLEWPDWRHSPRPRTVSRVLRASGIAALAVPIALLGWENSSSNEQALGPFTVVLAGAIPRGTDVATLFFLVGLAAVVAAPIVGAWPPRRARTLMRVVSFAAVGTTVLLASHAWIGIGFAAPHYATLGAPSSSGCRVIVADTTFFTNDSADIGVLAPGSTRVEWLIRGYTTSRGVFDPFTQVGLSWQSDTGTLHVSTPAAGHDRIDGLTFECAHDLG